MRSFSWLKRLESVCSGHSYRPDRGNRLAKTRGSIPADLEQLEVRSLMTAGVTSELVEGTEQSLAAENSDDPGFNELATQIAEQIHDLADPAAAMTTETQASAATSEVLEVHSSPTAAVPQASVSGTSPVAETVQQEFRAAVKVIEELIAKQAANAAQTRDQKAAELQQTTTEQMTQLEANTNQHLAEAEAQAAAALQALGQAKDATIQAAEQNHQSEIDQAQRQSVEQNSAATQTANQQVAEQERNQSQKVAAAEATAAESVRGAEVDQQNQLRGVETRRQEQKQSAEAARDRQIRKANRDADNDREDLVRDRRSDDNRAEKKHNRTVEQLRDRLNALINQLPRALRGIGRYVNRFFDEFNAGVARSERELNNALDSIKREYDSARKSVTKALNRAIDNAKGAFEDAKQSIQTGADRLISNANRALDTAKSDISKARDQAVSQARNEFDRAKANVLKQRDDRVAEVQRQLTTNREKASQTKHAVIHTAESTYKEAAHSVQGTLETTRTEIASNAEAGRATIAQKADTGLAAIEQTHQQVAEKLQHAKEQITGADFDDIARALNSVAAANVGGMINGNEGVSFISDKLVGLGGGAWETVRGAVIGSCQAAGEALFPFVDRLTETASLLKDGVVDQAIGKLCESVLYFARDVVGSMLTLAVNSTLDINGGIIDGFFRSRPLTQDEKDFAHAIFDDQINLSYVRIAETHLGMGGIVMANVIYIDDVNLSSVEGMGLFAHELTHVFQDQRMGGKTTVHATREVLSDFGHGDFHGDHPGSRYELNITSSTTPDDLGAEQQAELVGNYEEYLASGKPTKGAHSITTSDLENYEKVLNQMGLFFAVLPRGS